MSRLSVEELYYKALRLYKDKSFAALVAIKSLEGTLSDSPLNLQYIDYIRKKSPLYQLKKMGTDPCAAQKIPNPEEAYLASEQMDIFCGILSNYPVLYQLWIGDMTVEEVAAARGTKVDAVYWKKCDELKRLRKALKYRRKELA